MPSLTRRWPLSRFAIAEILRWALADRAARLSVVSTCVSLVAGPFVALLIASRFTPVLQGYYYTFGSVLALQVFLELGLSTVIVQFASHEWAGLGLDNGGRIIGQSENVGRLVNLARLAFKWYGVAGLLASLLLGIGGSVFFSGATEHGVDWMGPWLVLSVVAGITLMTVPGWALLQGCGQVSSVFSYRVLEGVLSTTILCAAIIGGAGLWAVTAAAGGRTIASLCFLRFRYWPFFRTFLASANVTCISWRQDIWPMQWRIALSWLSGYLSFSLFTPVLFQYHGPVLAGQWGMTWGLAAALSSVSTAWVSAKSPTFGSLIASRDYAALDRIFWRVTIIGCAVAAIGAAGILSADYLAIALRHPISERLLSPLSAGLILAATVLMQISYPQSAYLRAHKKEPFLALSIVMGILTALSTLSLGRWFGPTGAAGGYLAIVAMWTIPVGTAIWWRCRHSWQASAVIA